jgi:hypothetical protein
MRRTAFLDSSSASGRKTVNLEEEILKITERMRLFFVGTGMRAASRHTVEKWATEIEIQLKQSRQKGENNERLQN